MTERLNDFPTDPDIDLTEPAQRGELTAHPLKVLGAISAGGGIGAIARWGLSLAIPHDVGQLPWATLLTNVGGCAAIGVLMFVVHETSVRHPLVRPFFGVGILGGFTTFSTYVVDLGQLTAHHRTWLVAGYGAGTLIAALTASWFGLECARRLHRRLREAGAR